MRRALSLVLAAVAPSVTFVVACSSNGTNDSTPPVDAGQGESIRVDAPCSVLVDQPPLLPADHVMIPSNVDYSSNPPSSGPHYPYWAAYKEYSSPVPRQYYVHNLEHGAVVFLYKCATAGGCADVVHALEAALAALPTDPICDPTVRVRALITPDPLLDVPVAAAAWGWTYKAECVDAPSIQAFALAHYGQGPEQICANGIDQF